MPSNPKLQVALRKNRGDRLRPGWIRKLRRACGKEVSPQEFLPLAETDRLKEGFVARLTAVQGLVRRNLPKASLRELEHALAEFAGRIESTSLVLFNNMDEYIGAVQLPSNVLLPNFLAVWDVVGEDFRVATRELESGLCVEMNFYDTEGRYVKDGICELALWGIFAKLADVRTGP